MSATVKFARARVVPGFFFGFLPLRTYGDIIQPINVIKWMDTNA